MKLFSNRTLLILFITTTSFVFCQAQIGRFPLSPVQKIEQKIGFTDIKIVYSRPSIKGRKIFGDLVPFGKHWRTGANRNTTIEFSEDVSLNSTTIEKGKYSIITIPNEDNWNFILYRDTDNWDVPEEVLDEKIAVSIKVIPTTLLASSENLTISIENFDNFSFELNIKWAKTQISIPFDLTNRAIMEKAITKTLAGPSYDDYYSAARYELEAGKDYSRGLKWINKAIESTDKVTWWDYRIKAYMLKGLNKNEEAKKWAKKGLEMAKSANRSYGIKEFGIILKDL